MSIQQQGRTPHDPPVSFPPHPNPRKPHLEMPPGAWDTHFHIWGPPHLFPYVVEGHHFTPPGAPIEHYLAVAKVLGFDRGVLVQPSFHRGNMAIMRDALGKAEGRLRGMVVAEETFLDADVHALHRDGIRGVRIELRAPGSFDIKIVERQVAHAAKASWVVALHLYPGTIISLADFIRSLPGPIVIENFAQIEAHQGLDQEPLHCLLDLAKETHIWLKTASAYRMLRRGSSYEQVVALAKVVHAASPDRVVWGTDWPHGGIFEPGLTPNDGDLVDMLVDFVPDEISRRKLLVDNPKRLFDFD